MTPDPHPSGAALQSKPGRCQHCYATIVEIRGHWLDGKTRSEQCMPISSGQTVTHKPLPVIQ